MASNSVCAGPGMCVLFGGRIPGANIKLFSRNFILLAWLKGRPQLPQLNNVSALEAQLEASVERLEGVRAGLPSEQEAAAEEAGDGDGASGAAGGSELCSSGLALLQDELPELFTDLALQCSEALGVHAVMNSEAHLQGWFTDKWLQVCACIPSERQKLIIRICQSEIPEI